MFDMPNESKPKNIDDGKHIDWGKTSRDYARHRPGPPASFYQKITALKIGLPQPKSSIWAEVQV